MKSPGQLVAGALALIFAACTGCTAIDRASADEPDCPADWVMLQKECVQICESHEDCSPDGFCDQETAVCAERECFGDHSDCDFQFFCTPYGSCAFAGDAYCRPCEPRGACISEGSLCIPMLESSGGWFCGVDCSAGQPCPSGYDCQEISYVQPSLAFQCVPSGGC